MAAGIVWPPLAFATAGAPFVAAAVARSLEVRVLDFEAKSRAPWPPEVRANRLQARRAEASSTLSLPSMARPVRFASSWAHDSR
jgi:hypothetical protein